MKEIIQKNMPLLRILFTYFLLTIFALLLYPKLALGMLLLFLAFLVPDKTRQKAKEAFRLFRDKIIEIWRRESRAVATFFKKRRLGLYVPDSSRERADCWVPIRWASCLWEIFFSIRCLIIDLIMANSGSSRSYSALISGSLRALAKTLLKGTGLYLSASFMV